MTSQTVDRQALLSIEFSSQEYLSVLLFPSPGDLPDPEIKSWFPTLQADTLPSELPNPGGLGSTPGKGTRSCMLQLKSLHSQIIK